MSLAARALSAKRASQCPPRRDGPKQFDYEYRRNGVVNLFVPRRHRSWRRVKVTDHRAADDFGLCMRELVDVDFPEAERIRVVLDNLSTRTPPLSTPPSRQPRRAASSGGLSSTTRPCTPAHSTWSRSRSARSKANVSIAASKAPTASSPTSMPGSLSETKAALEISWMFSTDKARTKMDGAGHPQPSLKESQSLCKGTSRRLPIGCRDNARRRRKSGATSSSRCLGTHSHSHSRGRWRGRRREGARDHAGGDRRAPPAVVPDAATPIAGMPGAAAPAAVPAIASPAAAMPSAAPAAAMPIAVPPRRRRSRRENDGRRHRQRRDTGEHCLQSELRILHLRQSAFAPIAGRNQNSLASRETASLSAYIIPPQFGHSLIKSRRRGAKQILPQSLGFSYKTMNRRSFFYGAARLLARSRSRAKAHQRHAHSREG